MKYISGIRSATVHPGGKGFRVNFYIRGSLRLIDPVREYKTRSGATRAAKKWAGR